jgi:hypothetical protein
MAVSSFVQSRRQAIGMRMANDLRILGDAFHTYAFLQGTWPADTTPGVTPAGMEEHLPHSWTERTAAGGNFDWDQGVFGVTAAVSIFQPTVGDDVLRRIDEILDDGNLSTGRVRSRPDGIMLVLEE